MVDQGIPKCSNGCSKQSIRHQEAGDEELIVLRLAIDEVEDYEVGKVAIVGQKVLPT
jgi:hypothetical protein